MCGAMVVADRYCFGSFPSRERIEIEEGESAFDAICRHYLHWNQCARFMSGDKIDQRHLEVKRLVDEFHADGVVYENMKFCEFWSYEKVLGSFVLQNEMGVPCCTIEKEYALEMCIRDSCLTSPSICTIILTHKGGFVVQINFNT